MLNNPNPQEFLIHSMQNKSQKQQFQLQSYAQSLKSLLPIFALSHEQRTTAQLNKAYKILQKIKFFKSLQSFSSPQMIKNLIKHGKLLRVNENYLVCEKDFLLSNFIIALHGDFGIIGESTEKPVEQEVSLQLFQEFKYFSSPYLQFLKKKQNLKTSKIFRSQKVNVNQSQISNKLKPSIQTQFLLINQKLFRNKAEQKKYPQTIISLTRQSLIFSIDFKKICELMREEYNKSLTKQMNIFLTFSCFSLFNKQKLRQIIEESQKITLKKNEILFKQGQQDNRIFILKTGQIALQKTAALNHENPNDFYRNRLYIKRQSHGMKLAQKIEPVSFADFSKVFNTDAAKKKIKLTCISPISIFGEQEIVSKKSNRQTTAKVISQQAELFVFSLNQIQKIIPIGSSFTIDNFLKILEQQITNKKILYRQQKLGSDILYLSKTNKNGFFLHNQAKTKDLAKRKSIHAIGKTLQIQKSRVNNSQDKANELFVTASYTCHNFQDFYQTKKQDQLKQGQMKQQKSLVFQEKNLVDRVKYTNQEKHIIKLLHGHQRSNNSSRNRKFGRSQNPFQCTIDLQKPLFSTQYFRQQIEKSKKLDKDLRKSKLQVLYSNSTQSTFIQSRNYKTLSTSTLANSQQKKVIKRNFSSQK